MTEVDIRHAIDPETAKTLDTGGLRRHFHVGDLFAPGEIRLVYSHYDRLILGSVVPDGGTLTLESLRQSSGVAISSSLMKVFWLPLVATLGAWLWGFRGADLAILFLYFASPTAAASFVMAKAVGGNHQLAAAIIVLSTLATVVTTNLGLFVLQWAGWI